jgi:hypothetical protein
MTDGLRYAALGTGKTRKVPDVEALPCPGRPGPHWLRNSAQRGGLVTACIGCGLSWAELDAQARNRDELDPCDTCGTRLVRSREWRAASHEQRRTWAVEGIGPQQAPGLCHGCYQRARRKGARAS